MLKRIMVGPMFLLLVAPFASAFEVDGFRNGMSYQDARALIEEQSYSQVDFKDGHIGAWDAPPRKTDRTIFLNFCKDRLVQVQKNLQPRFDYLVRLVDEKRKQLGKPLDAWSRPTDLTSPSESNSVSFLWRDGSDFLKISFAQFSQNNQLYILYEIRNSCYEIPY